MKPRHLLMGAALIGAAALVLFGDRAPNTGVTEAVVRPRQPGLLQAPAPVVRTASVNASAAPAIHALIARETLIGDPNANTPALFGSTAKAAVPLKAEPPPPPPPPMAPPVPYQVIGKAVSEGQWQIYLARGDRTYVATVNAVLDGQYKVEAIQPPFMTVTYLPLNQKQQLNIGVLE